MVMRYDTLKCLFIHCSLTYTDAFNQIRDIPNERENWIFLLKQLCTYYFSKNLFRK